MPKRDDILLLNDIISSAEKIFEYTENLAFEDFLSDNKTIDAVVRNFEIIGEASNLISNVIKTKNKLVEWRLMVDFRNILIHHYFGVDYDAVWDAIKNDLVYNYTLIKKIQ